MRDAATSSSVSADAGAALPQRGPASPTIPPVQGMQASVMLVPKPTAESLQQAAAAAAAAAGTDGPIGAFLVKCRLAWHLFFPPPRQHQGAATPNLSPKELGKQRLSMILVADRAGMSPNSIVEMKRNTLAALSDCMDLEDLQDAHLRFTMTRENGVTYSMAVPILREGPYSADGSVAGQAGQPGDAAAAAAAADVAAASWDAEAFEEEEEEAGFDEDYHDYDEEGEGDGGAGLQRLQEQAHLLDGDGCARDGSSGSSTAGDAAAAAAALSQRPERGTEGATASAPADDAPPAAAGRAAAGMDPELFRELLVEELVHDVEALVATTDAAGGGIKQGGCSPEGSPGVLAQALSQQLQAAVEEVQHLGSAAAREGPGSGAPPGPQAALRG